MHRVHGNRLTSAFVRSVCGGDHRSCVTSVSHLVLAAPERPTPAAGSAPRSSVRSPAPGRPRTRPVPRRSSSPREAHTDPPPSDPPAPAARSLRPHRPRPHFPVPDLLLRDPQQREGFRVRLDHRHVGIVHTPRVGPAPPARARNRPRSGVGIGACLGGGGISAFPSIRASAWCARRSTQPRSGHCPGWPPDGRSRPRRPRTSVPRRRRGPRSRSRNSSRGKSGRT